MGNALAYMMLAGWPVVVVALFQRLPREQALIWSLLAGYLVLPPVTRIDLPMQPDLDKHMMPSLAAAVCLMALGARPLALSGSWLVRVLIALFVFSPYLTSLANPEPLVEGITYRPAYGFYDAFGSSASQALLILPFVMARSVLAGAASTEIWLRALVVGGVAYAIPMLVEIRMSPQINVWVYGFFAHDFLQMIRYGGYRPMVFLSHGLWVALFAFTAAAAAAALARYRGYAGRSVGILLFLLVMVVLCKSAGALLYTLIVIPLLLVASGRQQLNVAAAMALVVAAYPILRAADLLPTEAVGAFVTSLDADRGGSLTFRLVNETELLAHAFKKPLVGWGSWGRHMLVDPVSGEFATTSDGRWIILLGSSGIFGIIAEFGIYILPVWAAWRSRRAARDPLLPAMVLIHAATLIDLIPNATQTPLTMLTAGLILGQVERLRALAPMPDPARAGPRHPAQAAAPVAVTATATAPAPPAIRTLL